MQVVNMRKSLLPILEWLAVGALFFGVSCAHDAGDKKVGAMVKKGRRELIRYYERQPDDFKGKDLWVAGRCYFNEGQFEKAKSLFQKYSAYAPTDPKGFVALGNACFALKEWNEAIEQFGRADALGDDDAIRMLAASYFAAHDFENVRRLAPRLANYVQAQPTKSHRRLEIVGVVIATASSVEPPDKALFDECAQFLPKDFSSLPEDIKKYVLAGFKTFGAPEHSESHR